MNTFALDMAIKATLILAAAAAINAWLRRRASAASRHFALTIALAALVVLPLAATALPVWFVTIPLAPSASVAWTTPAIAAATTGIDSASSSSTAPAPAAATSIPVPHAPTSFDPYFFAFALYSAGAALLLARLVAQQFALKRLAARAAVVRERHWLALLNDGAHRLRIRRPVHLLQSEDDVMPFTFGTARPTIVLPAAAQRWSTERVGAVILHELAHIARADCLAQRLASLACALYWPHPSVWWAARRLRVEREFACDDRVLSSGTAAPEYATHLLEIAHTFRRMPAPATALGMARARQLEHRLLAVLDAERNRGTLTRRVIVGAAVGASLLLVPLAAVHAGAVADERPRPVSAAAGASQQDRERPRDRFSADDYSGTWELHPAREPGMVNVNLRTGRSQHGMTLPLSRFEGLNEPGMTAAVRDGRIVDGTVHFASRRDAGTFTFEGVCRNQMCGGTYVFAPDPAFPARLAKYGIGEPTASEQYELAMQDVGVAYLEGLKGEGYAIPDVHTLVRAAEHGVSLEYVKAMSGLGYKQGTLDPLIRMRDHGVDPNYVKGMASYGFTKLDAEQLVRLRDHGVNPEYVRGMRDVGYNTSSVGDLVTARDHGVDPQFARGAASLGYKDVPLDTLIRMRDHGVDPEYVRGLTDAGYRNVAIESLVRMRDHGVDPNYVRELANLGYKDVPLDSLIRMRDHGVDPEFVRRVQQREGHLSVEDLIRRRDRGDDGR